MQIVRFIAIAYGFALVPTLAAAQQASAFEAIAQRVTPGQQVVVKDIGGDRTRGKITEITATTITVHTRETFGTARIRTFDRSTVATIRRSDRLWNGMLIGLGAGIVGTEVFVYNVCGPRGYDDECSAIATGVGVMTMVPAGLVIGALVDKAVGNQLVYSAERRRTSVQIAPLISPITAGVAASIRF